MDAQHLNDIKTVATAIGHEGAPTPEVRDAAVRVVTRMLTDVASIADSLRKIAQAQSDIAGCEMEKQSLHRQG